MTYEEINSDAPATPDTVTELANQVIAETDIDKTKDLIALFNWNLSKKNVTRILKLNNLFDDVTDQMVKRFQSKPDQFSNSDLLDYMKAVQGAIAGSSKVLDDMEEPPQIVQNNTQINVNIADTFDRESRQRILDVINATIANANKPVEDVEFEDKTESLDSNSEI